MLWCVLASIVLHVALLLSLDPRIALAPPVKALLVLTARLAPVATTPSATPSVPKPTPAATPEPASVPPPPKPTPKPRVEKPAPAQRPVLRKPEAKPAPAPQKAAPVETTKPAPPEPPVSAPGTAAQDMRPVAPGQASSSPAGPAGAVTTDSAASSGSEIDKGTLEQYRLALIVATRRYKRYPAIAMEKGWQGKVEVRLRIGANGMLAGVSVKTSSGHEILDKQAVSMLRKGKTTVPIPANLRGREFAIDVPVIFNLDNPNS
ncbi:MAG: energy transducer TonB [Burkholderiales bacterium]|nr:energy transducer TonB [Burkholderiales bacterium]